MTRAIHPELEGFPVVVTSAVSWNEMDAFQHMNNVVYFSYFEDARIRYLYQVGWFALMEQQRVGPIVASTHARFRLPVKYPDTIHIGARIVTLAEDRVTFEHRIVSEQHNAMATEGQAVVVCFDYAKNAKCPLPTELRATILQLEPGLPST